MSEDKYIDQIIGKLKGDNELLKNFMKLKEYSDVIYKSRLKKIKLSDKLSPFLLKGAKAIENERKSRSRKVFFTVNQEIVDHILLEVKNSGIKNYEKVKLESKREVYFEVYVYERIKKGIIGVIIGTAIGTIIGTIIGMIIGTIMVMFDMVKKRR